MKAKVLTQIMPDSPKEVRLDQKIPFMYWPLGSDNVKKIGSAVKDFGRLTLYPKDHVDAMMTLIANYDIPLFVNPQMFTLVPQLDLPISEEQNFVSDQYGIFTCDLVQILSRAHIKNIVSCHYFVDGYCGQFGYIGNPFFGTFWVYNDAKSKVGFGHYNGGDAPAQVKKAYQSVNHKRNISPLASCNFFVGFDVATGIKTIYLSRVYGDNTHFQNALPKLLMKLEELGYNVVSYTYGDRIADSKQVLTFSTIPTFLTVAASLNTQNAINAYRSQDIVFPKPIKVTVVGGDDKPHPGFMVAEYHTAYSCWDASQLMRPLKPSTKKASTGKADLEDAKLLAVLKPMNSYVAPHGHYDLGLRATASCPQCKTQVEASTLRTIKRKKYCANCLQKAFFFDGVNNEFIPYEEMGKNSAGQWITPRAIKAQGLELDKELGYYVIPKKVETVGIFTITREKITKV